MKSIKIKLLDQNSSKTNKLLSILSDLGLISKAYLPIRHKEIQDKTYLPFKEHYSNFRVLYPSMNSGVIQSHLRSLDSSIKIYIGWCKKKHKLVSFPDHIKTSIPLRNDMFSFEYNEETKTFDAWLKFLRLYFPLSLCSYHKKALQDMESISDSSIIKHNGTLYLRLVFKTKEKTISTNKSIGIDIGIAKPIVCSDGKQFGSGRFIKHKKLEFGKKRARNQSKKEAILQTQSRWTNDLNHKLSRELVDYCLSQDIDVLGLEKLEGTQLSNRRFRKYNWAFKDLLSKITYKAELAGLRVISVDPRGTSQTCSCCGLKDKTNRISQSLYVCSCGSVMNADINAAKNIQRLSTLNGSQMNLTNGCLVPETQQSLVAG